MIDNENWLLNTAGDSISSDIKGLVKNFISSKGGGKPNKSSAKAVSVRPSIQCEIKNINYNPSFWNQPSVQQYNNCYNYASNDRTDTFAQPGNISGHPNDIMHALMLAMVQIMMGAKLIA